MYDIEPGLTVSPGPAVITFATRWFHPLCSDARSGDTLPVFQLDPTTLSFDSVSCQPDVPVMASAETTVRWRGGPPHRAVLTIEISGRIKFFVKIVEGPLAGMIAEEGNRLYPIDGSCESGGVVRGFLPIDTVTFSSS